MLFEINNIIVVVRKLFIDWLLENFLCEKYLMGIYSGISCHLDSEIWKKKKNNNPNPQNTF